MATIPAASDMKLLRVGMLLGFLLWRCFALLRRRPSVAMIVGATMRGCTFRPLESQACKWRGLFMTRIICT
jgi:hypothetical protein